MPQRMIHRSVHIGSSSALYVAHKRSSPAAPEILSCYSADPLAPSPCAPRAAASACAAFSSALRFLRCSFMCTRPWKQVSKARILQSQQTHACVTQRARSQRASPPFWRGACPASYAKSSADNLRIHVYEVRGFRKKVLGKCRFFGMELKISEHRESENLPASRGRAKRRQKCVVGGRGGR